MKDPQSFVGEHDVLVCVNPAQVDLMWPHVKHFIHAAVWTGIGDDTEESIKVDLDSGNALLWIVWDGKGLLAAAVTSIYDTPARKVCMIRACAGREIRRWQGFIKDLEEYARSRNCKLMRIHGRPGWKAVLDCYREPWIALEKELK